MALGVATAAPVPVGEGVRDGVPDVVLERDPVRDIVGVVLPVNDGVGDLDGVFVGEDAPQNTETTNTLPSAPFPGFALVPTKDAPNTTPALVLTKEEPPPPAAG